MRCKVKNTYIYMTSLLNDVGFKLVYNSGSKTLQLCNYNNAILSEISGVVLPNNEPAPAPAAAPSDGGGGGGGTVTLYYYTHHGSAQTNWAMVENPSPGSIEFTYSDAADLERQKQEFASSHHDYDNPWNPWGFTRWA